MIERQHSNHRMSQIVAANGMVFLAGQVAHDPLENMQGQTRQILSQIDNLLALAKTDKSKLLNATIWITDMRLFQSMNEIWDAWVDRDNPPTRACVEARLARPELLVEIQVVATR